MEMRDLLQALFMRLKDIGMDVDTARLLVDDGKEVKCSRKLQGVTTKLNTLLVEVMNLRNEQDQLEGVIEETDQFTSDDQESAPMETDP